MVEHEIDDHTCHRHIKPDGKRYFCPAKMFGAIVLQTVPDRYNSTEGHIHRQQNMAPQNTIIDVSDRSRRIAGEFSTTSFEAMVENIANQKNNRDPEAGKHRSLMRLLLSLLDQHVSKDQQQGGKSHTPSRAVIWLFNL